VTSMINMVKRVLSKEVAVVDIHSSICSEVVGDHSAVVEDREAHRRVNRCSTRSRSPLKRSIRVRPQKLQ